MDKNIYQKLAKIQETNWYFRAKRDFIQLIFIKYRIKPQKALDIGAGIGANIKLLQEYSKRVDGVDNSRVAVKIAKKKGLKNIFYGDALTFSKSRYDFILCSDIIEHIDENKFFANLKKIVSPCGMVLITVPAFNFLWGYTDEIAHHKKRYQLRMFKKLVERNHFEIIFLNYWNILLFIPMVLYIYIFERGIIKLTKKKPEVHLLAIPKFFNKPLNWLMKIENKLCLNFPLPFGINVVALIKKTKKIDKKDGR